MTKKKAAKKARGKKGTHKMPDGHMMSDKDMKKNMKGKKMPPWLVK